MQHGQTHVLVYTTYVVRMLLSIQHAADVCYNYYYNMRQSYVAKYTT